MRTLLIKCMGGLLFIVSGCSDHEFITEYYSDGTIKSKTEYLDNLKDGQELTYYEDGTLESKGVWINGQRTGKFYEYYQDGSLKRLTTWINNKQTGDQIQYNVDGSVFSRGVYQENNRQEVNIYKDSKIYESQFYDDEGFLVYIRKYDSIGNITNSMATPLFENSSDTLSLGIPHTIKFRFGVELEGEIIAYTGISNSTENGLIDSIEVDKIMDSFQYQFTPITVGDTVISFLLHHDVSKNDTMKIDDMFLMRNFYVLNNSPSI